MTISRSKYGNVRVKVDGYTFDSKKESKRYAELKLLEKTGRIRGVLVHPDWEIEVQGKTICRYEADFAYRDCGKLIIEDVKGVRTEAYKIKKKLMKAVYGIDILET